MIAANRIRFAWPNRDDVWESVAAEEKFAPFVVWRGTWKGRVFEIAMLVLMIGLGLPMLAVPRPQRIDVYVGRGESRRALIVRWLVWAFYIGPKPAPADPFLTSEQIAELQKDEP